MAENLVASLDLTPASTTRKIRRVVTGTNGAGESVVVIDGISPHTSCQAGSDQFVVTQLWRTTETPADNSQPAVDLPSEPLPVTPPQHGSVFRTVEFPPDSLWRAPGPEGEEMARRQIHATDSIDYCIVLSGEIWAVLDAQETKLSAGDVLVQRGTNHAWSNRSNEPCLVAFVLIGGNAVG
ncbi:cupin domain-containing protein [Streptomyces sp. NBC_00582]|uniref:cupin domain-containing protein n=1 Tax=Streptomyces sp. NBC_00582 TaxID=2975783 RepID=UPI002E803526|nr:cupin domain-containing protein [Streptomyces sp. NBC_00582]WUB67444.1 cupin domain-containing protein [Streptomyces sp. NBC_00582]